LVLDTEPRLLGTGSGKGSVHQTTATAFRSAGKKTDDVGAGKFVLYFFNKTFFGVTTMKTFKHLPKLAGAVALVLAGTCALTGQAYADGPSGLGDIVATGTLSLPGSWSNYNTNIPIQTNVNNTGWVSSSPAAGAMIGLTFNGVPLPPVYCVDLYKDVYLGSSNTGTQITNNGYINDALINNAPEIAYLVDHFSGSANTVTKEDALQAAIWHVRYDGATAYVGANTPGGLPVAVQADPANTSVYNQYLSYLAALTPANLATVNLADIKWISPGGEYANQQGLVTTPITGALFFVAPALLGLFGSLRRKSA